MSNKKVSALRMEMCYDVKITGGQYIVEHDGSADASAIDIVGSSRVEIGDVIARAITHQQIELLQDIEFQLNQKRQGDQVLDLKIDEAIEAINSIKNANQNTISNKVSELIIKLVPLSEFGVNVLEMIGKVSESFS